MISYIVGTAGQNNQFGLQLEAVRNCRCSTIPRTPHVSQLPQTTHECDRSNRLLRFHDEVEGAPAFERIGEHRRKAEVQRA